MVKWNNTNENAFPVHGETVIIDIGNIYYIAIYNYTTKHFVVTTEPYPTFSPEKENIKWTVFKD